MRNELGVYAEMACYALQEDAAHIFYIGSEAHTIQEVFDRDVPRLYGVLRERTFQLLHIFVPRSLRNKGCGTTLLHEMAQRMRDLGCRCIELDDMSERHRQSGNLYLCSGFVYRNRAGPEMTGSPICVLKRTSSPHKRASAAAPPPFSHEAVEKEAVAHTAACEALV